MKRSILFLFLCIFAAFLSGCFPDQKTDFDFFKVVIADRVFKIPKGYLDGRKAIGKDTESIVLEYSLPGFNVLPKHPEERDQRQALLKEGRMRGMLLEAEKKRPSFDIATENLMRGRQFIKEPSLVYGLEKYISQLPKPPDRVADDFFIERGEDGSVKSYLRCSPPGKDKVPGGRHRFIDKGLLYNTHWSIKELPNWKQQQIEAIHFIDHMEIKTDENNHIQNTHE